MMVASTEGKMSIVNFETYFFSINGLPRGPCDGGTLRRIEGSTATDRWQLAYLNVCSVRASDAAQRVALAERCAAEPGPPRTPASGTVPALRSGMKNAAPRPGHEFATPPAAQGFSSTSRNTISVVVSLSTSCSTPAFRK